MNTREDPKQMNKACTESQMNEHYACSVLVYSLPTLRLLEVARCGQRVYVGRQSKGTRIVWVDVPRSAKQYK
jgi:hypothetical protein